MLDTATMTQRAPLVSAVDAFKSNNFNVKNLLDLQENSADGYKTAYRIIDAATAAAAHMDILPGEPSPAPSGPSPAPGDRADYDGQNPYSRWFQTTGTLSYPGECFDRRNTNTAPCLVDVLPSRYTIHDTRS